MLVTAHAFLSVVEESRVISHLKTVYKKNVLKFRSRISGAVNGYGTSHRVTCVSDESRRAIADR